MEKMGQGLVQIFWGDGKGKTTSALGAALRACGSGFDVHLVQFMKNGASSLEEQIPGEIKSLKKFVNFSCKRFGTGGWMINEKNKSDHIKKAEEAFEHLKNSLNEDYDLVVADEILYAIQLGLLSEEKIISLIKNKPKNKELILTGSHKPFPKIFELADLVTEVKKIKHPHDKGILARKGIEY
ncbi:MAG: cob(I)yrinic acid a,c-diamide adenosyltransferase [Nanoarchaeota archaeon]|nr:cob(I)yrinic acid a,c-diamide adenosyltransferase [Nanoarchaeota archaeon]MBU0977065.1 cob(I)yrinic acid a,c-diamide adenosyltransferase [Nanoarchaeota archaeon]